MTKRIFDLFLALVGIAILLPLFLIIAILIKLDSPGSVFFRQIRIGRYGREFRIYKFRTMVTEAESIGKQITVANDIRITRSGRFLRKYKLDELPQLFNVAKGEMSFVGPRPEVAKYVALYTPEQRRVLEVLPGITDLASIKFRNESELLKHTANPEIVYIKEIMPQKLELNMQYIAQISIGFDILIILRTLLRVIAI